MKRLMIWIAIGVAVVLVGVGTVKALRKGKTPIGADACGDYLAPA